VKDFSAFFLAIDSKMYVVVNEFLTDFVAVRGISCASSKNRLKKYSATWRDFSTQFIVSRKLLLSKVLYCIAAHSSTQ
jgi:hypothetical protein